MAKNLCLPWSLALLSRSCLVLCPCLPRMNFDSRPWSRSGLGLLRSCTVDSSVRFSHVIISSHDLCCDNPLVTSNMDVVLCAVVDNRRSLYAVIIFSPVILINSSSDGALLLSDNFHSASSPITSSWYSLGLRYCSSRSSCSTLSSGSALPAPVSDLVPGHT